MKSQFMSTHCSCSPFVELQLETATNHHLSLAVLKFLTPLQRIRGETPVMLGATRSQPECSIAVVKLMNCKDRKSNIQNLKLDTKVDGTFTKVIQYKNVNKQCPRLKMVEKEDKNAHLVVLHLQHGLLLLARLELVPPPSVDPVPLRGGVVVEVDVLDAEALLVHHLVLELAVQREEAEAGQERPVVASA